MPTYEQIASAPNPVYDGLQAGRGAEPLQVQPSAAHHGEGERGLATVFVKLRVLYLQEIDYGHQFLFIPFWVGLGAFWWLNLADPPNNLILVSLACTLGMAAITRVHINSYAGLGLFITIWSLAGAALAMFEAYRTPTVMLDTPVTTLVSGVITAREADDRGRTRYTVAITETADPVLKRTPTSATLIARTRHDPIDIGEGITGRARLSPPSGPALPGLNDFAFASYFRGIGAVGYFYGPPKATSVVRKDTAFGSAMLILQARIQSMRVNIGDRIRETIGGDAGAIGAALITGEERSISRDALTALRDSGLAHVLAISGLNMALAAGTFLVGARAALSCIPGVAQRFPVKKIAAAGALVMVTAYILISGSAVSAVRAWIMICIMLFAVMFDRPSISLRNIALSAIIILAITPSAVTGPGFQMSFAATLALVAGYATWRNNAQAADVTHGLPRVLQILRPIKIAAAGLFISSLIGGLSTLIYSVGYFQSIPAYGLVGNVVTMPLISIVIMPCALIAMLLMPFGLDTYPLLLMGACLKMVLLVAQEVASWGGQMATGRIHPLAFFLIGTGGIVACLFRSRLSLTGAAMVVSGLLVLIINFSTERPQVLISEDGRLVGYLNDTVISTNRLRPPAFIYDQWRKAVHISAFVAPIVHPSGSQNIAPANTNKITTLSRQNIQKLRHDITAALQNGPARSFTCAKALWCSGVTEHSLKIIWFEHPALAGTACDLADIAITPLMLRMDRCRTGAKLVTGRTLRQTGALEIYTSRSGAGRTELRTTQAIQTLKRPWNRHRTYDWRRNSYDEETKWEQEKARPSPELSFSDTDEPALPAYPEP